MSGSGLFAGLTLVFVVWISAPVHAATYLLPEGNNQLIGDLQYVMTSEEDTLLDIARKYDLGFNEITAANPGIDPWLPGRQTRVLVPTLFMLPQFPREGVIINLAEMRMYYFPVPSDGEAGKVITYPIGIGREGAATPEGMYSIKMKIENPSWTVPVSVQAEMRAEGRTPLKIVPPGPDNPLGDYAMMIDESGLFIHGTNKPYGIGMRVSHGCIRLYPEDIEALVDMLPNGTPVRIIEQPYKFGRDKGRIYFEAHKPINSPEEQTRNLTPIVSGLVRVSDQTLSKTEWDNLVAMAENPTGIPMPVSNLSTVSLPSPW